MHQENKYIINELNICAAECEHCYTACLEETDIYILRRCVKLTRECAELCRMLASVLVRGAEHSQLALQLCATVCTSCAEECARHSHDHCQECARACHKCANTCNASMLAA